jgi:hypothetical protein
MALHLTDFNVAHQIAGRIRRLIARQDDGDVTAAARRLELPHRGRLSAGTRHLLER